MDQEKLNAFIKKQERELEEFKLKLTLESIFDKYGIKAHAQSMRLWGIKYSVHIDVDIDTLANIIKTSSIINRIRDTEYSCFDFPPESYKGANGKRVDPIVLNVSKNKSTSVKANFYMQTDLGIILVYANLEDAEKFALIEGDIFVEDGEVIIENIQLIKRKTIDWMKEIRVGKRNQSSYNDFILFSSKGLDANEQIEKIRGV